MPSFCAVKNCENKYTQSANVSFHKFPLTNKNLLEKWIEFANRGPKWKPSKWSAICSRHFSPNDFRNHNSRRSLKKTAVPGNLNTHDSDRTPSPSHKEEESKLPDSSCRLCGICCRPIATFATNFEIFGMIQKCFPTLNIQLDDNLPKDMCAACLNRLNTFSEFVDAVLETQKLLEGKFRNEKFIKPPERQLKIKQEPVVNVKQEVAENFDSFLSDELEEDQDCEQKFSFCDFPVLNTQDIINNCDIMEIINLDDPFIDIPDDENVSEVDQIINPDFLGPKPNRGLKLSAGKMVHEHNYAMPIECKDSFPFHAVYKIEKPEDKEESANNIPSGPLITAKPKQSTGKAIVSESTILNSSLRFSDSPQNPGKLMVTSVSDLQPLPTVETNVKKPNIVVLNESIVKTGSAFQLHPCSMCDSQFFSAEGLSHHVSNAHNQPAPMVVLPRNTTPNQELTTLQSKSKSISCPMCSMTFPTIHGLLNHKRGTHSKAKRQWSRRAHECPICEKFFISKIAFKNHRKFLCQPEKPIRAWPFKCNYCSKNTFNHWRIYRNHETLCKRRQSKEVKKPKSNQKGAFPTTETLPAQNKCNIPSIRSNSRDYNLLCLGCDKKFAYIDNYYVHYTNRQCKFKPLADEVLAFCRSCNKLFTKFEKLRSHRHFQILKKYECSQCHKTFANASLLSQHRITHTDIRKHKCELCEKIFKRRGGLHQHMKGYHLKMKPHECEVCKRRFALKADMNRCKHSLLKS